MTQQDQNLAQFLASQNWEASLRLQFSERFGRTAVMDCSHQGPLRLQRPFYPEGEVCHAYVVHPPGGVVGGDSLLVDVHVESQAHSLITTPGATKLYRSDGRVATINQALRVDNKGILEWLPLETIVFDGANAQLNTDVFLEGDARCIAWDFICLGRPANDESFESGSLRGTLNIYRDGELFLFEPLSVMHKNALGSSIGLKSYPMSATMFATHMDDQKLELLREKLNQSYYFTQQYLLFGITLLDDIAVIRVLGHQAQHIHEFLSEAWQFLRPLVLNKEPSIPRIWAT